MNNSDLTFALILKYFVICFEHSFHLKVQAFWTSGSKADIALDDISLSAACFDTGNLSASHMYVQDAHTQTLIVVYIIDTHNGPFVHLWHTSLSTTLQF